MILASRPSDFFTNGAERLANRPRPWLEDARRGVYPAAKRVLDVVGAALGLLLLTALLLIVAVLIRIESPGPVFFAQTRIGRRENPFRCWKFRSMTIDAEQRKAELMARNEMPGGTTFKMKHDPRITRVGRFIRKASIDELPQLWNVLIGEMSLVGPRPPVPAEVARYSAVDRQRLSVKPGITCTWQVTGRSDIPFREQVALDLRYIQERSLLLDIRLLLMTVPAVLLARGAY